MSSSPIVDAFSEEEQNVKDSSAGPPRSRLDLSDDDIERYRKAYDLAYEFGEQTGTRFSRKTNDRKGLRTA